jgi:hypothetical protein
LRRSLERNPDIQCGLVNTLGVPNSWQYSSLCGREPDVAGSRNFFIRFFGKNLPAHGEFAHASAVTLRRADQIQRTSTSVAGWLKA